MDTGFVLSKFPALKITVRLCVHYCNIKLVNSIALKTISDLKFKKFKFVLEIYGKLGQLLLKLNCLH